MLIPSDIKKQIKNKEKNHKLKLLEIDKRHNQDKKRIEGWHSDAVKDLSAELKRAEEFGGLMEKYEAYRYLGITRQRFEVVAGRGQFRKHKQMYAVADLKKWQKNKKAGRPWHKVKVARPSAAPGSRSNG